MEPAAKSYPVAVEPLPRPPPQTAQLGQGESRWRVWARRAALVLVLVAVTAVVASAVYQARHSPRDLALVITTYYLLALLFCCVRKLQLMPSAPLDVDPATAAAWEPERRRTKCGLFVVSVALVITFAVRVAVAMPNLASKLIACGLIVVGTAIAFYFVFRRRDGQRRRPDQLSPEQRV